MTYKVVQAIEYHVVISLGIQRVFAPGQAFRGQFQSFSSEISLVMTERLPAIKISVIPIDLANNENSRGMREEVQTHGITSRDN